MIYNVDGIKDTLIAHAVFHKVWDLIGPVIENEKFYLWSGSSRPEQHHYGKGGLATHTLEVVENCQIIADKHKLPEVDQQKLFLAALYHDIGKIWDYTFYSTTPEYSTWKCTEHKNLIHHISRSALFFNEVCSSYPFKDEVIHCILSHHGQREWGSPVQPRTKIAWILHLCDGLSARIADCGGIHV